MVIISIGIIKAKIFIPIFGGLIRLLGNEYRSTNPKFENLIQNPFLLSIYTEIGMILAFIPLLIIKKRTKKRVQDEIVKEQAKVKNDKLIIRYEYYDIYQKTKYEKYKLIFISTILDFSQTILVYLFCMKFIYNLWIFDIIFISLFSYLILKTKLYKHQYFSMISIILLGFGLNIIQFFKKEVDNNDNDNDNQNIFSEIISKFIGELCFCLNVVINKYNMEKIFCTSYEICMWEGLINLILFSICFVVLNVIGGKEGINIAGVEYPNNLLDYINEFDKNDTILIVVTILMSFIYNLFILKTCEDFTPSHVLILYIIHEFYYYLEIDTNLILNIFGFMLLSLILFMFLFFIEILELNLCGLSTNTKKNIWIRADTEATIHLTDNFDEDQSFYNENENENENNFDGSVQNQHLEEINSKNSQNEKVK